MEPGWPADHAIGVYLSVDGRRTLVATAKGREDVSALFRSLAASWDTLTALPALSVEFRRPEPVTLLSGRSVS